MNTSELEEQEEQPHSPERIRRLFPSIAAAYGPLRLHLHWRPCISPQPARFLRQLSRVAAKHTTQDRTKYTRCARSYRTYHGQCISHAIVITDAHHIGEEVHNFKKQRLSRGGA